MASIAEIAELRQNRLISINRTATNRSLLAWQRMDFDNLDLSWLLVGPSIVQQVSAAQLVSAKGSDSFTAKASTEYDFDADAARIVPEAFVGVDGSGRDLEGLLHGAVTTTKQGVAAGLGPRALEAGAAYLASMIKTAIADIGRASDMVSATGKGYTHYVRVVNPGACSRCAILAGISDYKTAFKRHPACKCTSAPVMGDGTEKLPKGVYSSTDDYFDSLSQAEQDRVFTKAGAQAIRDGADPLRVVSSRRGATGITTSNGIGRETRPGSGRRIQKTTIGYRSDGSPIDVYTTSEATTRRGGYARAQEGLGVRTAGPSGGDRYGRTTRTRVMPETVYSVARTPAEARILLRDAGYSTTPGLSAVQQAQQAATDRDLADRLYRRAGFSLG